MAVCLICEDQDAMHRYVCYGCTNRMRRQLRELETYAAILAVTVAPLHGGSGRCGPGYDSRSPARDDVIVMLDWRTRTDSCGDDDDDSPIWSLLGTLHGLSIYIAGQLGHTEPMRITMTVVTAYLLAVVDRCALEKWVVDVAADIHDLHTKLAHWRTIAHLAHLVRASGWVVVELFIPPFCEISVASTREHGAAGVCVRTTVSILLGSGRRR